MDRDSNQVWKWTPQLLVAVIGLTITSAGTFWGQIQSVKIELTQVKAETSAAKDAAERALSILEKRDARFEIVRAEFQATIRDRAAAIHGRIDRLETLIDRMRDLKRSSATESIRGTFLKISGLAPGQTFGEYRAAIEKELVAVKAEIDALEAQAATGPLDERLREHIRSLSVRYEDLRIKQSMAGAGVDLVSMCDTLCPSPPPTDCPPAALTTDPVAPADTPTTENPKGNRVE